MEAWVTFAANNNEALQSLVMASSLQRVKTTRKIVIFIIKNSIHDEIRSSLEVKFDYVVNAEESQGNFINASVYAKIQIWKLTLCNNCVFIDPTSLVIRNCDELFKESGPKFFFDKDNEVNGVFVFQPSIATWKTMMKSVTTLKDCSFNKCLQTWIVSCNGQLDYKSGLPSVYNTVIDKQENFTYFKKQLKILKLSVVNPYMPPNKAEPLNGNNNFGSGVQIFLKAWRELFYDNVVPLLPKNSYYHGFIKNQHQFVDIPQLSQNGLPKCKMTPKILDKSIAIVGVSCRFPGANNTDEFWKLILEGVDTISRVPDDRWIPKEAEFINTQAGFLKCPVDEFDGKFFGISPREAQYMDPQQRMLLELSWEALENAGINPAGLNGSETGVFMGIWRHDYEKLLMKATNFSDEFQRTYLGNSHAATSARISFNLGLNGPNIATESGCSSSMVSIHLACESLYRGDSNLAIAGGVNLLIRPFTRDTMFASHVLAADGRCKTFDEKADGFGRAEGCGVIVLKRLSDAIHDNDRIMAIIRGSAVSQEGTTPSFGTPSKECQALSIERALQYSGVDPLDVSYVEAHGTGTKKGDPTEITAIASCYGENRKEPLLIGSVKTNIGHSESAAGVAGLIKVVLSMNKQIIPPHRNLDVLNPSIDLDSIPAVIPLTSVEWKTPKHKPRLAGVSSFGISGTNVHILLQEAPPIEKPLTASHYQRPQHILCISGKTEAALDEMTKKFEDFLLEDTAEIADICYTANVGRAHLNYRTAITGSSAIEIQKKLTSKSFQKIKVQDEKQKIAFLFPGQGSQYEDMGKELYVSHPVFKDSMDYCAEILKQYLGISLLDVLWGTVPSANNEQPAGTKTLNDSLYSQTAIFCVEYSILKLWKSFGITPDVVIGHSLGEFAAAVAADILTIEEVLKLVYVRTQLIDNLPHGAMMAMKASIEQAKTLLEEFAADPENGWIDIACINSADQIVLSAKPDTMQKFKSICKEKGIKTFILAATHAYHSRDMESILEKYFSLASSLEHKKSTCQYISGMTGNVLHPTAVNAQYWVDHCRYSVDFVTAIRSALAENCTTFIEIGPHPVLLALGMENIPVSDITKPLLWLPSIKKKENNWTTLLSSLAALYMNGGDVNWSSFDSPYFRSKLPIPTYAFQRQKYWLDTKTKDLSVTFNTTLLHPLIGRKIPLVTSDHVYQHSLDLENLVYLADHQVAHKILLPCTGMLEMATAAGHVALQGVDDTFPESLTPLLVEDFKVEYPLELEFEKPCHIQTLVKTFSDSNFSGFQISVNKQTIDESGNRSWKRHATCKFAPFASVYAKVLRTIDLKNIKSKCDVYQADSMYERFPDIGLTFGKIFMSIKSIWRNSEQILAQVPVTENLGTTSEYLIHPVLTDAMIQLFAFGTKEITDLFLPVGIKKFIWFARSTSKDVYIHAKITKNSEIGLGEICLYDDNGSLLAVMEGISVAQTSVTSFLRALNAEKTKLPGLYQESWRGKSGPHTARFDMQCIKGLDNISEKLQSHMESTKSLAEICATCDKNMDRICYLYIVRTFAQLKWTPRIGDIIDSLELVLTLKISSTHHGVLQRFLEILSEEGLLNLRERKSIDEGSTWEVMTILPNIHEINSEIANLENAVLSSKLGYNEDVSLQKQLGDNLALILQGKQTPLALLFPENKSLPSAEKLYRESPPMKRGYKTIVAYIQTLINVLQKFSNDPSAIIRILEIGAGTGGTSSFVFEALEELKVRYHYTYTDISPVLISQSKDKFSHLAKNIDFKVLNIEKDPLIQGFPPQAFDIIIASNVLHATETLEETVKHSRRLLAPGGHFILYETLKPLRTHDVIFGVLEGYWRFKDYALRPHHVLIGERQWRNLLLQNGFTNTAVYESSTTRCGVIVGEASTEIIRKEEVGKTIPSQKYIWLIISKPDKLFESLKRQMENVGRKVLSVGNETCSKTTVETLLSEAGQHMEGVIICASLFEKKLDSNAVIETILNISQYLLSADLKTLPKMIAVTSGSVYIDDQSPKSPFIAVLWGFMKTLKNENPNLTALCIDIDPSRSCDESAAKEICSEIWSNDGSDYQIALRQTKRHLLRLTKLDPFPAELRLPNSERFSICLPKTRAISDLQFMGISAKPLDEEEVEIAVQATSLNFRDVMVILRPDGYYTKADTIGTDYSGIVSAVGSKVTNLKVGDSVFGMTFAGAISSHTYAPCKSVGIKPDTITFNEAAAIPTVFLTAYYCLMYVAQLKRDETILIHVASGGVGLCAIQIARNIGAHVIVTAGSKRKRGYLRSLGIEHVYHSRNTEFGKEIRMDTNGGVDVVLNSLTGPNFKETSFNLCNKNARFVEMGKVGIWKPHEAAAYRPDVKYTIVDLEQVDDKIIENMTLALSQLLSQGEFKTLPYTRFSFAQCRDALTYLQKAKHIGKIILSAPKIQSEVGQILFKDFIFNDESSYLITGGLGGIGLEVAKMMSANGARHIVLVNRNTPTAYASSVLQSLRDQGVNVITIQCDIGHFVQCKKLLEDLKDPKFNLPPLRGIMHAAGTLSDAIISNQTLSKFDAVFHPKIMGAWHLHCLTQDYNLEHFVMFSSVAAILCPMGQSNHASANSFLDSLAHCRNASGLVGSSVNWGAWSDVGAAAKSAVGTEGSFGVKPFSPSQGIAALKVLLTSLYVRTAVVELDAGGFRAVYPHSANYMEEISQACDDASASNSDNFVTIDSETFWKNIKSLGTGEKTIYIQKQIEQLVRQVLKLSSTESVEENQHFAEMGMDSLMTVEMRNKLQLILGKDVTLNSTALSDHPTLSLLTKFLSEMI